MGCFVAKKPAMPLFFEKYLVKYRFYISKYPPPQLVDCQRITSAREKAGKNDEKNYRKRVQRKGIYAIFVRIIMSKANRIRQAKNF